MLAQSTEKEKVWGKMTDLGQRSENCLGTLMTEMFSGFLIEMSNKLMHTQV